MNSTELKMVAQGSVVLIPAHNEESQIGAALDALANQTAPPDYIVVICDNCTDNTADVARAHGADVFITQGNTNKKAGALNQVLRLLLPRLEADDTVLVQDADSILDAQFHEQAAKHLEKGYGGVGGVFRGGTGGGFVGHLQRNEYARYARDLARLKGRCLVITGTAAMFRVSTLREVAAARLDGRLPKGDGNGGVYDISVLTEDNELTFALKHLGFTVIAPAVCTLETEVMQSWRELWRQRLRWKRGAVENCFQYGFTKVTRTYWARQLLTFFGLVVTAAYLTTLTIAFSTGNVNIKLFWMLLTLLFVVERVVTVRYRGWKRMALAATMYELLFDFFLQACHAKAYFGAFFRTAKSW
ncbi:glycosyltransferase [Phytoactinopolyspora mesophila]|uniref:Glycosyltransferase n=1 Tax=Phytoactinopolyspora mesophila TaxID=2650750 RepID=A0A7K3LZD6_9ACTN|nr:glycosyltransferase family 2 protein [Phytoactinopolyspora mesophila]NDL56360.1 glycosyltransferase [Phytoactinopolyspora mesophila]